jgi:D-alanyl-lipoteichoic acid acyltransferase DltB (MBOAT superfamily)
MYWRPIFIFLIIVSTFIDYFAARGMEKFPLKSKGRKTFLVFSLLSNLGILFLFKYFNFFSEIIQLITNNNFNVLSLILPMGISFYTFQTLSYSIDVYRGERSAEKHLGYFALYVTFFPQLVAGPIERSTKLLPELKKINKYEYARVVEGLKKMTWGFFKKLVIADNLAIAVNHVYGDVYNMSGLTLLIATLFFAYQIYCDFSGYSDIAIGTAKIMGIELMENFKRPYLAKNLKQFWSRWHISLSTWFRDYLYIPIGGSRKGKTRTLFNVLIVFVISGLWHGAAFNFIIWGAIHGIYQIYENLTLRIRSAIWNKLHLSGTSIQWIIQWLVTMTVVLISWIFFRAQNLQDASFVLSRIFNDIISLELVSNISQMVGRTNIGLIRLIVVFFSIILLEISQVLEEKLDFDILNLPSKFILSRWLIYYIVLFSIILFGFFGQSEFIYFQF